MIESFFKNLNKVIGLLFIAVGFWALWGIPSVQAESSFILAPTAGVERTTGFYRENIVPGSEKTFVFYLTNNKNIPLSIVFYPADAEPAQNGGRSFSAKDKKLVNVGSWFTDKNPKEIILKPKERKEVRLSLKVPKDIKPGQYVGIAAAEEFVRSNSEANGKKKASLAIDVLNRMGIQMVLEYQPDKSTHLMSIDSFKHEYLSGGELQLTVGLSDRGTILEKPTGKLIVKDSHGKLVYSSNFRADSIYANTTADMTFTLQNKVLFPDQYTAYFEATYQGKTISRLFDFTIKPEDTQKNIKRYQETGKIDTGGSFWDWLRMHTWVIYIGIGLILIFLGLLIFILILLLKRNKKEKEEKEVDENDENDEDDITHKNNQ